MYSGYDETETDFTDFDSPGDLPSPESMEKFKVEIGEVVTDRDIRMGLFRDLQTITDDFLKKLNIIKARVANLNAITQRRVAIRLKNAQLDREKVQTVRMVKQASDNQWEAERRASANRRAAQWTPRGQLGGGDPDYLLDPLASTMKVMDSIKSQNNIRSNYGDRTKFIMYRKLARYIYDFDTFTEFNNMLSDLDRRPSYMNGGANTESDDDSSGTDETESESDEDDESTQMGGDTPMTIEKLMSPMPPPKPLRPVRDAPFSTIDTSNPYRVARDLERMNNTDDTTVTSASGTPTGPVPTRIIGAKPDNYETTYMGNGKYVKPSW